MPREVPAAILVIILLMFSVVLMPGISGNPLPGDIEWRGMGGGAPFPKNGSVPVYLVKEVIKAVIEGEEAHMTCIYTFRNDGNATIEMDIELPFIREPQDLEMYIDGENLPFLQHTYEYYPIYIGYYQNLSHMLEQLSSASFQFDIGAGEEVEVNVIYDTGINIYKGLGSPESGKYYYSYLVGTGRYWDHPIESARFEVRVPSRFYTEYDFSSGWNIRRTLTHVVFEKEYTDWVPERDLEVLNWEKTRGLEVLNLILVILGMGFGLLLLAVISSVIFVIWRRTRADNYPEE
ncbi:MAG: hypothetical protein ACMUHM_06590 [Thermoplasmatota archaeon]